MNQTNKKGLVFFAIGIALYIVFRNSIGAIAGLGFILAGVIFGIKNKIELNEGKTDKSL